MKFLKYFIPLLFLSNLALASHEDVLLTETNSVILRGEVSGESVSKIALKILQTPGDDVLFFIDSPGGSVFAGEELVTIMKNSGKNFTCIANLAASMAFVILQACDTRLVTDSAIIMQHEASFGVQGKTPNNISMFNFLLNVLKRSDLRQSARIGLTYEAFKAKTAGDWWMYGKEAVLSHTADDTVNVSCNKDMLNREITETMNFLFVNIKVVWSACPLITSPLKIEIGGSAGGEGGLKLDQYLKALNYRDRLVDYKSNPSGPYPYMYP